MAVILIDGLAPTSSDDLVSSNERSELAKKVVRGAVALGFRQVFVHCANIVGAILLARLLSPLDFGVYAIVTFLVAFLATFGGTGIAANLIRMSPAPNEHDHHAVFTFQQISVGTLAAALWFLAPVATRSYGLLPNETWLFRLAAASLVATAWMVPAQVQLERELAFHKLALIETIQAVLFNVVAVVLAWMGRGAISFGIALVTRAVAGALVANYMQPRCYGWVFDWPVVKRHLRFGLLYQSAQFFSLLKDAITPLLVGLLIGAAGVGEQHQWSMMLASYPVMSLMVLKRIYLPMFARL